MNRELDMIKVTEIAEKIVDGIDESKTEMASVLAHELEFSIKTLIEEKAKKMFKTHVNDYCVQCGEAVLYGQQYYKFSYSNLKIHYLCSPTKSWQLRNDAK